MAANWRYLGESDWFFAWRPDAGTGVSGVRCCAAGARSPELEIVDANFRDGENFTGGSRSALSKRHIARDPTTISFKRTHDLGDNRLYRRPASNRIIQ
jgi:hypothetical protein